MNLRDTGSVVGDKAKVGIAAGEAVGNSRQLAEAAEVRIDKDYKEGSPEEEVGADIGSIADIAD